MAWSTPSSRSTGDLITAAIWNQDVVDNVQYLHDNRYIHVTLCSEILTSIGWNGAAYANLGMYTTILFSHIDTSDLAAAYFSANIHSTNAGNTAYAQLYDQTNTSAISGSEISTTATSSANTETSSDIAANLPTTDVDIVIQGKVSDTNHAGRIHQASIAMVF